MNKKQKIYRAYIDRDKGVTDMDIAKKFRVDRRYVHMAVASIRNGSTDKLKVCMIDHKKHCLWESRYQEWFQAIDDFRGSRRLSEEFRILVCTMKKDKFTPAEIGTLTNRDRTTINHHLNKKV